jgi:hypothetical protein
MTHFFSDGWAVSPPPARLSRQTLDRQIALRSACLAILETEMIATCEAAAMGTHPRTKAAGACERWDRTTWHRYLAASTRLEATYGPCTRRLRQEVGQLERLMTLPITARSADRPSTDS